MQNTRPDPNCVTPIVRPVGRTASETPAQTRAGPVWSSPGCFSIKFVVVASLDRRDAYSFQKEQLSGTNQFLSMNIPRGFSPGWKLAEVPRPFYEQPPEEYFAFFQAKPEDQQRLMKYDMKPSSRSLPFSNIIAREKPVLASMNPTPRPLDRTHVVT